MSIAQFIVGDVFDVMADMPDSSVDLVVTSPPFLALRAYLPADHAHKAKEIGAEPTPAAFIDTLLALTAEWDRLLAPHGSICVELGDTYSGSGGAGGDYGAGGLREGQAKFEGPKGGAGWPLPKSATLIPELYRASLAYGMNPLTGQRSPAGQWRVRNTVRWVRPNPPVGALGDKFRPATSDMVIACKASDRWFDLDAVSRQPGNPNGAPPLDWWKISPGGYGGAHFAVFPPELVTKPIRSMCPREVCTGCGEPRRRLTSEPSGDGGDRKGDVETMGWSVCDCASPTHRRGVVLDPFGGTGTTGLVATGEGRDAILIDIDERNADLARERIGMFVTVEGSKSGEMS